MAIKFQTDNPVIIWSKSDQRFASYDQNICKKTLMEEEWTHTGEKACPCGICNKSFMENEPVHKEQSHTPAVLASRHL